MTQSCIPENSLKVFAQRLNNSAALCIEVGQYDRAILSLQRALELSKKHMNGVDKKTKGDCLESKQEQCQGMTLDDCIAFSEANSLYSEATKRNLTTSMCALNNATSSNDCSGIVSLGNKRRRIEITTSERSTTTPPMDLVHGYSRHNDYYVFTRPIRVPRRDQELGSVLFLAILFNLALAHHLKATTMRTLRRTNSSHSMTRAKSVQKARMLYQLILDYWSKLQMREGQTSNDFSSIRFRMILHNNLGQIYNWTNDPMKEEQCLQDLLSSVMFVTDQVNQHNSSSAGTQFCGIGFKRDLEGFFTNTEALTAVERCAQAA